MNKNEILEIIKAIVPQESILMDEPMKNHTTFRIGGPADIYVDVAIAEIQPLMAALTQANVPVTVMGNGSNMLVADAGIRGVVLSIGKRAAEITVEGNVVTAQSGALLSLVANTAAKNSLTGMEFAQGIPGSIGGAVMMNAGAYGGEMVQIIKSAEVLTAEGQVETWSNEELDLSYRHSRVMDQGGIVLSASLELKAGDPQAIQDEMADYRQRRQDKQPLNMPSAGSTFKRPTGYFAGKLIDDAGLRGYQVGGAQVSEKHCGFVVNADNATAADVRQLMSDVDAIVFEKFGVHLEPEVRMIGDFT